MWASLEVGVGRQRTHLGKDDGANINPFRFSLMSDRSYTFFLSLLLVQWTKRLMVPVAEPACGGQVK